MISHSSSVLYKLFGLGPVLPLCFFRFLPAKGTLSLPVVSQTEQGEALVIS